jgi:small subunit ribosomal protein S8
MSMNDPIADLLTRIRNAQQARKESVNMPLSKMKVGIAKVLKDEGYISDYSQEGEGPHAELRVVLKYVDGRPVIDMLKRYSRPGLRQYRGVTELPQVRGGLGIAIISTSAGIMSDVVARAKGQGGEVICLVA